MSRNGLHMRRLQTEFKELMKRPPPGVQVEGDTTDLLKWHVWIQGADESIYAGERYCLQFKFTPEYPFDSPEVVFIGKVPMHEHIYSNGHICLSILYDQWSPALSVQTVALSILSMLSTATEKKRPPDDLMYCKRGVSSPKNTHWEVFLHDEPLENEMNVQAALKQHEERTACLKVDKIIPLKFDIGNLAAFDMNIVELDTKNELEENLKKLARDNCQLLFNEIFSLPTVPCDLGVMAQLPVPSTILPREKPIPKIKPQTTWEQFASSRGIQKKRKRDAMIFDEASGEYKPAHGRKSKKNEELEAWCVEVPHGADPYEDQYKRLREDKKERIRKNDARRRKNLGLPKK